MIVKLKRKWGMSVNLDGMSNIQNKNKKIAIFMELSNGV
jgi:hypothetical protein